VDLTEEFGLIASSQHALNCKGSGTCAVIHANGSASPLRDTPVVEHRHSMSDTLPFAIGMVVPPENHTQDDARVGVRL
jgi:hypothetical protein